MEQAGAGTQGSGHVQVVEKHVHISLAAGGVAQVLFEISPPQLITSAKVADVMNLVVLATTLFTTRFPYGLHSVALFCAIFHKSGHSL